MSDEREGEQVEAALQAWLNTDAGHNVLYKDPDEGAIDLEGNAASAFRAGYAAAESAHHAQLLAVAEAVRTAAGAEWMYNDPWLMCAECNNIKHMGHAPDCGRGRLFALDLAAIIRSALDGSVASVGKAGE